MTTYALRDGDTLVVSVDGAAWETLTFRAAEVADIAAATAQELAAVINRLGTISAHADSEGLLVVATASRGGHASLEIDAERSTSAAALGLAGGPSLATGEGPHAARLVSLSRAPYRLPTGAEMRLTVDDRSRWIAFEAGITQNRAAAKEVAAAINAKQAGVAQVTRDGGVMLTSPTAGAGSRLQVDPGRTAQGKADAAAILGFVGASAICEPHRTRPAELACSGRSAGLRAVNLTGSPIELHFSTGTSLLPARGELTLAPGAAAHGPLQRLIERGAVRLAAGPKG